ncbi:MAG: polysaccharide deacetylase family protein [Clostridia bacterium]|nr:polysaccharide deacetylase family protein [Clostridia bacterium]
MLCLLLVSSLCLSGCTREDKVIRGTSGTRTTKQDGGEYRPVGGSGGKRVALTFDDGPHNVRTKAIVDELAKYGAHATFFVVGNRIDGTAYNGASALKYVADHGHELAIHGYTHDPSRYYDICDDATYTYEIQQTAAAIKAQVPNAKIKLMRPVGGRITADRLSSSEYSIIMWSVDSEDWRYKYNDKTAYTEEELQERLDAIVDNVMSQVRDGSVILMHDIYESTYDATVEILKRLYEEGYEVVTVSELFGSELKPGTSYSKKESQ